MPFTCIWATLSYNKAREDTTSSNTNLELNNTWSETTLHYRMMAERYPNIKEEVGSSVPGYKNLLSTWRKTCHVVNCLLCFDVGLSAFCLKKRKKENWTTHGPRRPYTTGWWRRDTQISKHRLAVRFPGVEISSLFEGKLARWSTASYALTFAYWPSVSKKEKKRIEQHSSYEPNYKILHSWNTKVCGGLGF